MNKPQAFGLDLRGASQLRALTRARLISALAGLAVPLSAAEVELGGMALIRAGGALWVRPQVVAELSRHVALEFGLGVWSETLAELEVVYGCIRLIVDDASAEACRGLCGGP